MVGLGRARTRRLIAGALAAGLLAACSSGSKSGRSSGTGGAGGAGQPAVPGTSLSWVEGRAEQANGTAPAFTVQSACGSPTDTYLAELLHTPPTQAKVLREWGDIVPGGKQIAVSGKVTHTHMGPADLPMSHVYGYDLSLDIGIDPAFQPFAKNLGPVPVPDIEMHAELSSGYLPHAPATGAAAAPPPATWEDQADANMTNLLPGFEGPAVGDRVVAMGRWVIDCGHDNFQTELHPLTFLAWSHDEGGTTTVHLLANPYRDTELYSPDVSILGKVNDPARLQRQDTKPFPQFLVGQVFGLATSGGGRLHSQELIEANRVSPPPFTVCAPGAGTGTGAGSGTSRPALSGDLVRRTGVDVEVAQDKTGRCATVAISVGKSYTAVDADVRQCTLPWAYLNGVAGLAVGGQVNVQQLLNANVPVFVRDIISTDPDSTCAAGLVAAPVSPDGSSSTAAHTDDHQPFPVYGALRMVSGP